MGELWLILDAKVSPSSTLTCKSLAHQERTGDFCIYGSYRPFARPRLLEWPLLSLDTLYGSISGYTFPEAAFLATRRYHDCPIVVRTLRSHWLRTCPSSRAAYRRPHSAVKHAICTALHEVSYTSALEPSLLVLNFHLGNPRLGEDQQIDGIESQSDDCADLPLTRPVAPTFVAEKGAQQSSDWNAAILR